MIHGRFEISQMTGQAFYVEDTGTIESAVQLWRILRENAVISSERPNHYTFVNYRPTDQYLYDTSIDVAQRRLFSRE